MTIPASELLNIDSDDLDQYKLHLSTSNDDGVQPLDVFVNDWNDWVGWNKWRGSRDDFSRQFVFSLIDFYPESDKWLFGGIFEILARHEDHYEVTLKELHKSLIGRLLLDFHRYRGLRGRAFYLETFYDEFEVSEIFKTRYEGRSFPGFDGINLRFHELEHIVENKRRDWRGALQSVKGVYAIFDTATGMKYVGSAYGDEGIWSRWSSYAQTGHGWNAQLRDLIDENGLEYARENLRFALLEHRPMRADDQTVIERENYWKKVLLSRGDFGYNRN